mmetsp:Transcript_10887/g.34687  ORF Transcript_10887/g.34687 Transcript_10887/m.34687 type:complete len:129 (+) Transcript_10887:605-991(+)
MESVPQPKTLEERLERGRSFAKRYPSQVPVLVDSMANEFDEQYAAWPERFYMLSSVSDNLQPVLHLVGEPTVEFGYDRSQVFTAVERLAVKTRASAQAQAQAQAQARAQTTAPSASASPPTEGEAKSA